MLDNDCRGKLAGVKYIGDGKFVVTEEWLCEVFSQAVSMNVADYLGVDTWQGWWDTDEALEELYPDYAKDYDSCQGVAEAMIYDWMNTD